MKHFSLSELFPQKMAESIPKDILFEMLDPRLIITIDKIRGAAWPRRSGRARRPPPAAGA